MEPITIREYDNRHPADIEQMRGNLAAEVVALRAEVRRLRQNITNMENQHALAGNVIQWGRTRRA